MTTAKMISELPVHDDALVDFDSTFSDIDREVALARERAEIAALLLDVDWLVEEMCGGTPSSRVATEALDISLELTPEAGDAATGSEPDSHGAREVA